MPTNLWTVADYVEGMFRLLTNDDGGGDGDELSHHHITRIMDPEEDSRRADERSDEDEWEREDREYEGVRETDSHRRASMAGWE
jgi:hypothetical protein